MPATGRHRADHPANMPITASPRRPTHEFTSASKVTASSSSSAPGNIPASAGSTVRFSAVSPVARAHPRVRGKHRLGRYSYPGRAGSSPRPRGAPYRHAVLRLDRRAHPRVRGEHRSNPHTKLGERGLIPASAGSTFCPASCARRARAHPRVRGEHGSSPQSMAVCMGLIPASAGSTPLPARTVSPCQWPVCGPRWWPAVSPHSLALGVGSGAPPVSVCACGRTRRR